MTSYFQTTFEKKVKADVEETRTIEFIINSENKDRHKDVLNYDNWNFTGFNMNPIVGYQHNVYGDNMCAPPNPDDVLGKASNPRIEGTKGSRILVADVTFEPKEINPMAEKVFRKVLFGSLNATSVGILPIGKSKTEYTKDAEGNIIDTTNFWGGQELLEFSIVNIPANKDAVRRSMKNHTMAALSFVQKLMEDLSIKDIKQMRVQEILDLIDKKYVDSPIEQLELELSGPDPNLGEYIKRLNRIKK